MKLETSLLNLEPSRWLARLERQAPDVDGHTIITNVPATARPGDLIPVTITGGRGYDLAATFNNQRSTLNPQAKEAT